MAIKYLGTVLDLLFPETNQCSFCWSEIEGRNNGGLCAKCLRKILEIGERLPSCPRCGRFITGETCPNCYDWSHEINTVKGVVPYDGIFKEKIFDLKYNGNKELASSIGYLMAQKAKKHFLHNRDMLVVPIPLHPLREEERGYNQSVLLARVVARELNRRCEEEVLVRRYYEKSQTVLGRRERRINMLDAFAIKNSSRIKSKNVLLVDDIITTGATMAAAAAVLRAAGAEDIMGLTWAAGFDRLNKDILSNFTSF